MHGRCLFERGILEGRLIVFVFRLKDARSLTVDWRISRRIFEVTRVISRIVAKWKDAGNLSPTPRIGPSINPGLTVMR